MVVYVANEKNIKPVNLRLPSVLIEAFHGTARKFGVKERTLAAAVAMYCDADLDTQWRWYQKVGDFYAEPSASQEGKAGDVRDVPAEERGRAKQKRPSAKGRG